MVLPSFTDPVAELNSLPTKTVAGLKRSHSLVEQIDKGMRKLIDEAQQDIPGTIGSLKALDKLLSRDY